MGGKGGEGGRGKGGKKKREKVSTQKYHSNFNKNIIILIVVMRGKIRKEGGGKK